MSAHHKRFNFEWKEQSGRLATGQYDVPYNYYQLRVEGGRKKCILKELESLNISRESLFPGLESSATAIVEENRSKDDRQKLTVTFEPSKSNARPAVVRYGDHCLKIYRDRIVYRDKTKSWKAIMGQETVKAYALVPLTSNEEKLGRFHREIKSCGLFIGDNIHFEIEFLGSRSKGAFYVIRSGVVWMRTGWQEPKVKSWKELHEWMTSKRPDEPVR